MFSMLSESLLMLPLCGGMLFGFVAGFLGFFIVARGYSLLVDVVCHATLPGVIIPYFFITQMNPVVCLVGGSVTGLLSIEMVKLLERSVRLKIDGILGVVVTFFFGLGLSLVTIIQKYGFARQGIVHTVFLGNAGLYRLNDIYVLMAVSVIICFCLLVSYYRLYAYTFDTMYCKVYGFSLLWHDLLVCASLVALGSVGIIVMGSIVMSAALIIPPVWAKQVTHSFCRGLYSSSLYGGCMGFVGVWISSLYPSLPTGPVIALCLGTGLIIMMSAKTWYRLLRIHSV